MGLSLNSEEVQQNLALLPAAANVSASTHLSFSRYRFWFQEQRQPRPRGAALNKHAAADNPGVVKENSNLAVWKPPSAPTSCFI